METVTNAIMLREAASRGQVAVTYGVIGLLIGALFMGRSGSK